MAHRNDSLALDLRSFLGDIAFPSCMCNQYHKFIIFVLYNYYYVMGKGMLIMNHSSVFCKWTGQIIFFYWTQLFQWLQCIYLIMIFNYSFQDPLVPYVLVVHYMMRWHHLILHILWHGEDFSLQYFCTVQNKFERSSLYNIWDWHTYFLSYGNFYQLVNKQTSGNQLTVENDWIFQIFFLILCNLLSTQANGKKEMSEFLFYGSSKM